MVWALPFFFFFPHFLVNVRPKLTITTRNSTAHEFNQSRSLVTGFFLCISFPVLFNCWLLSSPVISNLRSRRQHLGKRGLLTSGKSCRITLPTHTLVIVPLSRRCGWTADSWPLHSLCSCNFSWLPAETSTSTCSTIFLSGFISLHSPVYSLVAVPPSPLFYQVHAMCFLSIGNEILILP